MEKTFSFTYQSLVLDDLPKADEDLCRMALQTTHGSYAPYSQFEVGAALRLSNGETVTGANQENASYPCGTCAERTALNYARTVWPDVNIEAIAVAAMQQDTVTGTPPYPCGLCRQSLAEVEHRQGTPIRVMLVAADEVLIFSSAECLLPLAFHSTDGHF